jgi:hypothetical protein
MANPEEGQLEFKAKGKTWVLSLSNRGIRSIEARLKRPWGKILSDMSSSAAIDDHLAIFTSALRENHKVADIKDDEIVDLVGPGQLIKLNNKLIELTFVRDDEGEESAPNPPQPAQP